MKGKSVRLTEAENKKETVSMLQEKDSSFSERPGTCEQRRLITMELVSEIKTTKVHSLIDKVYHPTNLRMAWEKVKSNRGAGGIDEVSIEAFTKKQDQTENTPEAKTNN